MRRCDWDTRLFRWVMHGLSSQVATSCSSEWGLVGVSVFYGKWVVGLCCKHFASNRMDNGEIAGEKRSISLTLRASKATRQLWFTCPRHEHKQPSRKIDCGWQCHQAKCCFQVLSHVRAATSGGDGCKQNPCSKNQRLRNNSLVFAC